MEVELTLLCVRNSVRVLAHNIRSSNNKHTNLVRCSREVMSCISETSQNTRKHHQEAKRTAYQCFKVFCAPLLLLKQTFTKLLHQHKQNLSS